MYRNALSKIFIVIACATTGIACASAGIAQPSSVHPTFDLSTPDSGPFPSNRFSVPDEHNLTGIRVNMPLPDCAIQVSDCHELNIINTLDGFNQLPRISVPFDGDIDPSTVSSDSVFLLRLGDVVSGGGPAGQIVGINRIVWDPSSKTLHAEADELLDEHTQYVLIVTNRVLDTFGNSIVASEDFRRFRRRLNYGQTHDASLKQYRHLLVTALETAAAVGIPEDSVAVASVFTTQSSTALLEKIRDQIKSGEAPMSNFEIGAGGARTVFDLASLSTITYNRQLQVSPPTFSPVAMNLSMLRAIPGVIGRVAFGKYSSPDYQVHPGEYIPPVATGDGVPTVQNVRDVYFNLYLPAGTPPTGGWPIAIFATGSLPDKNEQSPEVAAVMASHGIATIAINEPGDGLGPLGNLVVRQADGTQVTLPGGGLGVDQDNNNVFGPNEGRNSAAPRQLLVSRDTAIQSVADTMQLVRSIQAGMDVDGDETADVSQSRIYYFGHSAGAFNGVVFLAIEPDVQVGVLNSVGEGNDTLRLSANFRTSVIGSRLASRVPSLINSPGLTQIDGVPVTAPLFNENLPLRDESPRVNDVAGAMLIQKYLDRMKWATQLAGSTVCAAHLRKKPLTGVPAKSVLIQFSKSDRVSINPGTTALLRAGDLVDRTSYFRNDLAVLEIAAMPHDPHFLIRNLLLPSASPYCRAVQEQIAIFLQSEGTVISQPEPARLFEVPIAGPLPETLSYIP